MSDVSLMDEAWKWVHSGGAHISMSGEKIGFAKAIGSSKTSLSEACQQHHPRLQRLCIANLEEEAICQRGNGTVPKRASLDMPQTSFGVSSVSVHMTVFPSKKAGLSVQIPPLTHHSTA